MRIIIVGAGIAGLSAALALAKSNHEVTVVESAQTLAEVGAGVQLTPNTTKWLRKWEVLSDILAISALPESFNVIDGVSGTRLGSVSFEDFEKRYGGPYLVIHRADIHRILHDHAVTAGVTFRLNSRVDRYFPDESRLTLMDGTSYTADVIVAVDGIKSHARQFLGNDIPKGSLGNGLEQSGWAAYRLMAEVSQLAENDTNREVVTSHRCNCMVGDGCSVMTYKVKGTDKLNLVLSHRDNVDTTDWTQEEYQKEISRLFQDFSPDIQGLLRTAMSNPNYQIKNWPASMVPTLPRWCSDSGKLVLMGDATHAMPFYLSMGVSMAAEDAAALTECLDLMVASESKVSLRQAMALFEAVRKPRAELVRDASLNAGRVLHLPAGDERNTRDAALQNNGGPSTYSRDMPLEGISRLIRGSRYGIIDNTIRDWCYGYDVVDDVRRQWKKTFG